MTTEQTPSVEEDHVIRLKALKKKIVNGPPFDLSYPQILNVFLMALYWQTKLLYMRFISYLGFLLVLMEE